VVERLRGRGRSDDTEEVIRHRQQVYRRQTAPLLAHYADIVLTVRAVGAVEEINDRALEALSNLPGAA
jgi:adenylate kinase